MPPELSILVIGSGGLLGQACMGGLGLPGGVGGVDIDACDITQPVRIEETLDSFQPDWVVNTAACTDVDGCEGNRALAWAVNARGAGNLARACSRRDIGLIQISTDFIFDGWNEEPYREDAAAAPLSVYGASKWGGEEEVRSAGGRHLIVRTSWLFGRGGKNFPDTILNAARSAHLLRVVSDQRGAPTYAPDLAAAIGELIRKDALGTVHVTNRGSCSWYEYALFVLAAAGRSTRAIPITSEELARPAARPKYSVLSLERYERITGRRMRPWQETVREYLSMEQGA
ncbi:MAG: dTDP-4-dehydrorhamnose reductase [PVC group bacterium]